MHSKKIFALLLALLLFTACGINTKDYPRVEGMSVPVAEKRTLSLVLPNTQDEILEEALVIFQSKLEELSDQQLTLELIPVENPQARLGDSEVDLILLSQKDLQQLDPSLNYLSYPFLFSSAEEYLLHIGSPTGAIAGSRRLQNLLQGSMIGSYYGGSNWVISRGVYRDELGFYNTFGANSQNPMNQLWNIFGAETIVEGTEEQLFASFLDKSIKYCEVNQKSQIPEDVAAKIKEVVVTNHRYNAYYLVANNAVQLPVLTDAFVREAFSYSIEYQNRLRTDADVAAVAALQEQYAIPVNEKHTYEDVKKLATKFYKNNYRDLGIEDSAWEHLHSLMVTVS